MSPTLEILAAFIGSIAAFVSALFVFYKWAVDQENAKNEQLRREIKNEVRAEIYQELLRLNVQWLSGTEHQRNTIRQLSDALEDDETRDSLAQETDERLKRSH